MATNLPVKLAILWHMHQPDYRDASSYYLVLPWVRLHALKDYLDMPLMASKYNNVKVTFNLVPALIDQLELYIQGGMDPHLALSKRESESLSSSEKLDILQTFFSAPKEQMIFPYPRYKELYKKAQSASLNHITPTLFSSQEILDLQVWSNLVWIDPIFRDDKLIKSLFKKERNYSESEKLALLDWQIEHIKKIIPTYKKLYQENKIDVSFTPYYHPILPLLCDTYSAKEAMPNMTLPKLRFKHPEDADAQIKMSADKFKNIFETDLIGMWPSEGSVSEQAVQLIADNHITWVATDEEVLINSLKKSSMNTEEHHPYKIYSHKNVKFFFRDHNLSDRIGFVYSGMPAEQAVDDFISHIHIIRERFKNQLDDIVIPVILDGENAWEYFVNDGKDFLELLYKKLSEDELIELISMSDAGEACKATELPSLFAGSWINHNFKIWIGHEEDNKAWDLLSMTRQFLVDYIDSHPNLEDKTKQEAWDRVYKAEGSDWCWWYGDEHQGEHNHEFDKIFRNHLISVYTLLQTDVPAILNQPIYQGQLSHEIIMPDGLVTPIIDGKLSGFYEWIEAGSYSVSDSGGAMHRMSKLMHKICFCYDHENLYFRIVFDRDKFKLNNSHKLVINFSNLENFNIEIPFGKYNTITDDNLLYTYDTDIEIAVCRQKVFPESFGMIHFSVSLCEDEKKIETIPEDKVIELDVPEKGHELFWPM